MDMRGFQFRNPRDGWAGTIDTDGTRTVYSSNDGGLTWLPHPLPVSPSLNPPTPPGNLGTDVKLLPGRGVLAVTLEGAFTSFDGGDTWRVVVRAPAVPYNEVAFEDATHWWAMQQDGDVYKTSDAGQSWVRVAPHRLDGVRFDIGIIDSKHAWVRFWDRSAPASGLALTADGGVHWSYANVPAPR
jgi:hypothetical protein